METLHISFQRVVDVGMFTGIKLNNSLSISHMFFADDVVFVGKCCESNIDTLTNVLDCFHRAFGLKINMSKSKIIGVHVESSKVNQAASTLGCQILHTPFKYLGTKVGGTMHQAIAWQKAIDKVKERLSKWKMKALSIEGRFTLLKSVLGFIPIFHMSIYKAPMRVLKELEFIRRQFFNGHDPKSKKASWVKWNFLPTKIRCGRVVKAIHGEDGNIGILKDLFPMIYALETYKDVNIRTKLEASSLETSLRRNVRGGAEQAQLIAVSEVSGNITLAPQADIYNWLLNNDGVYSVASLRKKIDNQRSPSKAFNLSRRGIDIGSLMCPLCDSGIETSTHLFFRCNMADQIYYKIARWWNVTYEGFTSYTEWLGWLASLHHPIKLKALLEGVFYITWWFLWGFRNKILFDSNSPSKAVLFDNIISSSFTWCRSRCKAAFTWNDWLKNPYLIIQYVNREDHRSDIGRDKCLRGKEMEQQGDDVASWWPWNVFEVLVCCYGDVIESSNFRVFGCKGRVVFDMVVNTTKYVLTTFDVEHNDELDRVEYKHLSKAGKKLTYNEQLFVIKAANENIGAMRAHNIYTGLKGSSSLVHEARVPKDFSFDYFVEDAELCGLFWADEVVKCNYKEFGDIVSFDATYKTNKKFVTVGLGLLKKETAEAYGWLLKAFKQAFVRPPNIVVTDQDEAMRLAVAVEFPESKHRLCISSWVPAFFVDSPLCGLMRTTSRSESENSFFLYFTISGSTLVKFMLCYEFEMERQRHTQEKLDHQSFDSFPALLTPLPIKEHVAKVYTRSLFIRVQKEIVAGSWLCSITGMSSDEGCTVCIIDEEKIIPVGLPKVIDKESTLKNVEEEINLHQKVTRHYKEQKNRYGEKNEAIEKLAMEASIILDSCVHMLRNNDPKLSVFVDKMKAIKSELEAELRIVQTRIVFDFVQEFMGVKKLGNVKVKNPTSVRPKGREKQKRIKSGREISIKKSVKKRNKKLNCCVVVPGGSDHVDGGWKRMQLKRDKFEQKRTKSGTKREA
nr:RNA-directed DNA polymerase, eukaryota [Tanacetum cinerariifolium]